MLDRWLAKYDLHDTNKNLAMNSCICSVFLSYQKAQSKFLSFKI